MKSPGNLFSMIIKPDSVLQYVISAGIIAAALMLIPFTAMQLTGEVNWSAGDFIVAWFLIFCAGFTYRLVSRMSPDYSYRAAVGVAVGTGLFLVWSNLAVGLLGSEDNPANVMFGGVLAVLFIGTIIARFQPKGMSLTLFAAALLQAVIGIIGLIGAMDRPIIIMGVTGMFVTLWLGSGLLFRNSAMEQLKNQTKTQQ